MNRSLSSIAVVVISLVVLSVFGQTGTTGFDKRPVKMNPKSEGTSVAIGLKNLSEKPVVIYTGPKDDMTNPGPREKIYEAHSTNTLYASVNEVVCVMNESGKSISCVDVMAGSAEMEIDEAGSTIRNK